MARPARRRLTFEDDYIEEPYIGEEDEDVEEEFDSFEDNEEEEEETIFVIYPAFYEVGILYFIAVVLSLLVTALIAYLQLPLWIAFSFVVLCFIRPLYRHILHNYTVYTLTTVKIEIRSGIFSKTSRNIPLRHVQDVTVSETFKERLIGIGDVVIDSAAVEGKILMSNIKDPRKYADLILNELQYWN
ncbi:MAG: PH domain-containing protein [Blastocatellales bacterium]